MRRLLALLALALFSAQTVETPPATESGRVIRQLVEDSRMEELRWPDFSDYRRHMRNLYAPLGYTFLWTANGQPKPQTRTVIALFEAADAKGINSVDYDGSRWQQRLAMFPTKDETALARFDVAMSITMMRYISDLHIGRINPRNVRFDLDIETKKYYLPKLLTDIAQSPDGLAILNQIEPHYDEYLRLMNALAAYRQMAADAKDEKPLPVAKVKPGEPYAALPQLTKMLTRFGDLTTQPPNNSTTTYSDPLVSAVKHFQSRHGLEPDGILSEKTFRALNAPLGRRVRQIQLALERWRWAPGEFEHNPIVVNIPEFRLHAWDDTTGHTAKTMNVVVGQTVLHQTPVFAGDMRYIVFRPTWSVPPTIQRAEIVPHIEKDPNYLAKNNYEIVDDEGKSIGSTVDKGTLARLRTCDLQVRQKPGPSNALGLVKFIFPNQNNVYLHSTPSQALFSRAKRDFSHGCIRVEDPVGLAAWALREQPEWTTERIKGAMEKGDSKTVVLKTPIPVMIIYTTAVVRDDGTVDFYDDIYGHDATLENALAAGYPYPA
ncbi:MAG TPA: L,D-transpeptidase family protein [Thermoanaerobaculia bacterium]|nr:L,D-transpeptidase family protein [Thermoanaerobaculia bacterium]